MKYLFPFLCLGVLLASPQIMEARITRVVEKTFGVQAGGKLWAATQGGNITIRTAEVSEVRIKATQVIDVATEAEADDILAKLALTMEQSGNDVKVEARYEKAAAFRWFSRWPPVSVSFDVTVPAHCNVDLGTSGGNITVASLTGSVLARTSGGNVTMARIDGEIEARTSGGNITLKEGTARAELHTSGGDISVDRAGGPTKVSTSGGNIRLQSVAQLLSASTSGGDVRAVITEPLAQDAVLTTSGGNVDVMVVPEARFDLDASTSGGRVSANGLTIVLQSGNSGKHRLVGAVNGGGPRLKLRSSGGDVTIRAR